MQKKMWMVRAGRKAIHFQNFEEKNYVAVGWNQLGDLTRVKSRDKLKELHGKAYEGNKPGKLAMGFGQIARFRFELQKGDYIITYSPEYRQYLVGTITSDYLYKDDSPGGYNHILETKWIGKVKRDSLTTQTKNSLGSIATLFQINEQACAEILSLLEGKPAKEPDVENADEESEVEDLKKEIQEKSIEFIKDNIQKLDWDEMQELVAGILRAMGYKTRVTSAGPDRGADIIASPDGLGLEQPRIRVEVKHRNDAIGAPMLRSFLGGLRTNDRGLYVSTGGFTKEARYEAERATVPATLVDIDELADLLVRNYDSADTETKALIPLVKLYWPA